MSSFSDELLEDVKGIFSTQWTTRNGNVVPESGDLKLGNDKVNLSGVVLYADISSSTKLVDDHKPHFAAELYKAFLDCAAKIIRSEGGTITAYDGDRIMAVYIGENPNTRAGRTALKINWARVNIINPTIRVQYPSSTYELKAVTAIDSSDLFVTRTGVRGANDLVWIGRASNHAAKLTSLDDEYSTWISKEVYDKLHESVKTTNGTPMWEERVWRAMSSRTIYRSSWMWAP